MLWLKRLVSVFYFNKNNLTLYHGSSTVVTKIDLGKSESFKDFGRGFYTTTSMKQAEEWSKKIASRRIGNPVVSVYKASKLLNGLKYEHFRTFDIEWLDFVAWNRMNTVVNHSYDLIIGPVADASTRDIIVKYENDIYGDKNSYEVKQKVIQLLNPQDLENQLCFITQNAVDRLTYIKRIDIDNG
jgi:hypothetical protein